MSDQPYGDSAALYWAHGWRGILPIPPKSKKLTLPGWTGHQGAVPSYADIQAWIDGPEGRGNVAIRLPDNVIGVDVDAYNGKTGAETLAGCEARWGPLPATWRSSARDWPSGIRFYRIPPGLNWPGELGPNVEIVQWAHRYAVVWPSLHPDTGTRYQWFAPDGQPMPYVVPSPEDLAELPVRWVEGLSRGQYAPELKAAVPWGAVAEWIQAHDHVGSCCIVQHAITDISTRFQHGARHEVLTGPLLNLIRLGELGHRGLGEGLVDVRREFEQVASDPTRGAQRSAVGLGREWDRAIGGAVGMVIAQPTRGPDSLPATPCACDFDLSSILPPDDDGRPRPAPAATERPAPAFDWLASAPTSPVDDEPVAARVAPEPLDLGPDTPETPLVSLLDIEVRKLELRRAALRIVEQREQEAAFVWPEGGWSARDELALPDEPVTYTVAHVMPTGTNVLLTAGYKSGKTTMVNNLARSLVDGTRFLGRFDIAAMPGNVAIWNYEVDGPMYRRWLRSMKIQELDKLYPFNLRGYRMPLLVKHVEDRVVAWLAERDIKFWVVDPFARAFVGSGEENSNDQVGKFLDTLDVIKRRAGVRDLVLPTHTGRAEMSAGQEHARGATRLDDWADVRWILTRENSDSPAYFRASGRDVTWSESQLSYDEETRTLTMGAKGNRSRAENKRDLIMTAILQAVRESPGINTSDLRNIVKENLGTMDVKLYGEAIGILKRSYRIRTEKEGVTTRHYNDQPGELLLPQDPS